MATVKPPAGAIAGRITSPVTPIPPVTEAGVATTLRRIGGLIVNVDVLLTPLNVAVMVTVDFTETAVGTNVNFTFRVPAGIVTEAGTLASPVSLLDRLTVTPPVGTFPVNVTEPVAVRPPYVGVGVTAMESRTVATTVSGAETVLPLSEADRLAVTVARIGEVVTDTVFVSSPDANDRVAGQLAAALSEARVTVTPLAGATPVRVTVSVTPVPPRTEEAVRVTVFTRGPLIVKGASNEAPL